MPPEAPTFISYSREDSEFALRLAKDLKAAGADVWLDQTDIAPGQRWARAVQDALQNSPRVLVVLSPASVNSHHVEDEVNFALDEGKTVIPIFYQECRVPFRLRPLQYVDFRTDYAYGMEIMLKTLGVKHQTVASTAAPTLPRTSPPATTYAEDRGKTPKDELKEERKQVAKRARPEDATGDSPSWRSHLSNLPLWAKIAISSCGILVVATVLYWVSSQKPPRGQTRDTPPQQFKIEVPPAQYRSSGKYVFEAHANALSGELTEPFRAVIKPQGYVQLASQQAPGSNQPENFLSQELHGYSMEGLITIGSADTRVYGNTSVATNKTTAVAVVRNLNLFDAVAADKVTVSILIDASKGGNNVPRISLLGTSFENLRIGGNAVAVDLENGPFEHGQVRLPMSAKDDQQSHGSSSGSLVKRISGNLPFGSVGNAIALPGVGTLFLGELIIDGDSYELMMMRLVTSDGEVRVATCQATVPRERSITSREKRVPVVSVADAKYN